MIDSLQGELLEKGLDHVVVDCHGVGYRVQVPANTVMGLSAGGRIRFHVHYSVTVDVRSGSSDHRLFGFLQADERHLFRQLIEVQGVSATLAMSIMGNRSPQDIYTAIMTGNESMLKGIKGIGPKLAQRMISELQGKMAGTAMPSPVSMGLPGNTLKSEALSALVSLGLDRSKADRAIQAVLQDKTKEQPELEELIRLSLKNI
jgi:holliday junction DNA helicase RuvA